MSNEVPNFTHTSLEPYDNHYYELQLFNGKTITFEYYQDLMGYWRDHYQIPNYLNVVIVKDKKSNKKKDTNKKGFK